MKTKWIGDRRRTGFLLVDADNEAEVLGSVHKSSWSGTWHARGGDERTGKFVPLGSWTEDGGGVVGAKKDVEHYLQKKENTVASKKRQNAAHKTVKEHDDNSRKPWVSNYPPLREWLNKHDARCMWQVPSQERPNEADYDWVPQAYIECWIVGRRPCIIVVRGDKMGWEIYTDGDTHRIDETLLDAERRLGLVKE